MQKKILFVKKNIIFTLVVILMIITVSGCSINESGQMTMETDTINITRGSANTLSDSLQIYEESSAKFYVYLCELMLDNSLTVKNVNMLDDDTLSIDFDGNVSYQCSYQNDENDYIITTTYNLPNNSGITANDIITFWETHNQTITKSVTHYRTVRLTDDAYQYTVDVTANGDSTTVAITETYFSKKIHELTAFTGLVIESSLTATEKTLQTIKSYNFNITDVALINNTDVITICNDNYIESSFHVSDDRKSFYTNYTVVFPEDDINCEEIIQNHLGNTCIADSTEESELGKEIQSLQTSSEHIVLDLETCGKYKKDETCISFTATLSSNDGMSNLTIKTCYNAAEIIASMQTGGLENYLKESIDSACSSLTEHDTELNYIITVERNDGSKDIYEVNEYTKNKNGSYSISLSDGGSVFLDKTNYKDIEITTIN